jgi:hypothetical protein
MHFAQPLAKVVSKSHVRFHKLHRLKLMSRQFVRHAIEEGHCPVPSIALTADVSLKNGKTCGVSST